MVNHNIIQSEISIENESSEDMVDISSVKFQFDQQSEGRTAVEFYVKYQQGDMVFFIVNAAEYELTEQLCPGFELFEIQCFSPISIFFANGLIVDRKKIDAGPRKGDVAYCLKLVPINAKDGI